MVNCLRILLRRIDLGFDYFKSEQIVLADKPRIDDLAFEVGETFGNTRRGNLLGRSCRQAETLEFVHVQAGAVAHVNDLARQFPRRDGDDTFLCGTQRRKVVVGIADDASNQRGRKFNHHVPGDRHDVGVAFMPVAKRTTGSGSSNW